MDKVLIITNSQDIHADLVLRAIQKRGVNVFRFHPDAFPNSLFCSYESGDIKWLDSLGRNISFNEISAVWYRRPENCQPDVTINDPVDRGFVVEESQHLIENAYMLLEDAFWVNPYFANIRARYKLLQRRIALNVGLEMPEMIVTNNPTVAKAFIERNEYNVVYKCLRTGVVRKPDGSSDLIFTNKISVEDVESIYQVRFSPCMFMQYVDKALELRVTIVGERVFTCAIYSQEKKQTSIDWRHGDVRYGIFELPGEIKKKLLAFMAAYGLHYGAFDLILTPDDRFVMLELNPNGQWAFVQGFTQLPISEAMADLLTERR